MINTSSNRRVMISAGAVPLWRGNRISTPPPTPVMSACIGAGPARWDVAARVLAEATDAPA